MELKMRSGVYCSTHVVLIATLWVAHCSAASLQARPASQQNKAQVMTATTKQSSTINDKVSPYTTTSSIKSGTISGTIPLSTATKVSQRNKRDILDSKGQYALFPDVHELFPSDHDQAKMANLQKFLMLLSKPKNTAPIEDEFDDEYDYDPPAIELVVGKKPGSIRSAMGKGPKSKMETPSLNRAAGGEEPTGIPIILHQHRMKKASMSENVIPEIFLRGAATSSRTQPEPKIMRKLLARIGFSRQLRSRSQSNDGQYYSLGQFLLDE